MKVSEYAAACAKLEIQVGVLAMPNEIFDGITPYLHQSDLCNMSRVCKRFVDSANLALYTNPCVRSSIRGNLIRLCRFLLTLREYPNMTEKVENISFTIECPKGQAPSKLSSDFYTTKRIEGLSDEGVAILNDVGQALRIIPTLTKETQTTLQDLRDAFYALILVSCPNIRTLRMEVEPNRMDGSVSDGSRILSTSIVSPCMDRLLNMTQRPLPNPINCLQKLQNFEIRSVIHCAGIMPPKFVADILQIQTLQRFTTDHFIPTQMPITTITSLKIVDAPCGGDILEKTSFKNCSQLTHLEVSVARIRSRSRINPQTVLSPVAATLTSLKLDGDMAAATTFSLFKGDLSYLINIEHLDIDCSLLPFFPKLPTKATKRLSISGLEEETMDYFGEIRIERWNWVGSMLGKLKTAFAANLLPRLETIRLVVKKNAPSRLDQEKFCEAQGKDTNFNFVPVTIEFE